MLALCSLALCRDVCHWGQGRGWGFWGQGDPKSSLPGLGRAATSPWQKARTIAGAVRMLRDLEKWGAGRMMLWGRAQRKALISQINAEQGCSMFGLHMCTDASSSARLRRRVHEHGAAIHIPEPRVRSQPAEKPPPPSPAGHQYCTTVLQTGPCPAARRRDGSPDPLSARGCCT